MAIPGESYFKLRLTPSSIRSQSQTHQRSQGSLPPPCWRLTAHIPGPPEKFIIKTKFTVPPFQTTTAITVTCRGPGWTLISPIYSQHVRYLKYSIDATFSVEKHTANKPFSKNLVLRKYSRRQCFVPSASKGSATVPLWLHTAQFWPTSSFMQLPLQYTIKGAKLKKQNMTALVCTFQ